MERQLLQLERDLETFSSPDDPNDMFFTKMAISFTNACVWESFRDFTVLPQTEQKLCEYNWRWNLDVYLEYCGTAYCSSREGFHSFNIKLNLLYNREGTLMFLVARAPNHLIQISCVPICYVHISSHWRSDSWHPLSIETWHRRSAHRNV